MIEGELIPLSGLTRKFYNTVSRIYRLPYLIIFSGTSNCYLPNFVKVPKELLGLICQVPKRVTN